MDDPADGRPLEVAAGSHAPIDPASVVDYTFPNDSPYLGNVTFRTAVVEGRLHGRLIGTRWEWCEYSADEAGEFTEKAARYGRTHRVPGRAVADVFYEALGKGGAGWRDLAGSLALTARADRWMAIAQQFGPEAAAEAAAPYRETFTRTLEHKLRALGQGGYPTEDPNGPIAPWLMLLGAMERDAKPSLIQRLFRR